MDLNRWGHRTFQKITRRYKSLAEFLGDVLEGEQDLITDSTQEKRKLFEIQTDLEPLLAFATTTGKGWSAQRLELLFASLAPYYEAGFLLKGAETEWHLGSMFLFGQSFSPEDAKGVSLGFLLPQISANQVHRARGAAVLREFYLDSIPTLRDSSAFLFRVSSDTVFLLILNRPHPWALLHVERTYEILQQILQTSLNR